MKAHKNIALVAHDNRKKDLMEWVEWNIETLIPHHLICTGTTGRFIEETIHKQLIKSGKETIVHITKLKSGPLGGDQQLGALIADGKVDFMIFFWDPMTPQPHDVDVKAPTANNRSTADFMISSPLMNEAYERTIKDFSDYLNRDI
jgi:methylglyoxal synthase